MANERYPVVTIQYDWNDVLRVPKEEVWISSKYLNENSSHGKVTSFYSSSENKVKLNVSDDYELLTHSNFSLVVKHKKSSIKVAFVPPTKAHKVHNKGLYSVCAAENAHTVSSCEGNQFHTWDSRTGEILLRLEGHAGPVYKCMFFPSRLVILSAGADGCCKIWSAEHGNCAVTLKGHTMAVADLAIIDKGRNIISVSKDGTAKLWDVGEAKCLADIMRANGPINCCCLGTKDEEDSVEFEREIGTGDKLLVVGCESGYVHCTKVAKREEVFSVKLTAACNSCCLITENSVLVGLADGKVLQFNIADGTILNEWHESNNPVLSVIALHHDLFIVGRQDGNCTVHSLNDSYKTVRVQLTGSDCDGIRDMAFNGKWIFSACRDGFVRKYDLNQITVHFK